MAGEPRWKRMLGRADTQVNAGFEPVSCRVVGTLPLADHGRFARYTDKITERLLLRWGWRKRLIKMFVRLQVQFAMGHIERNHEAAEHLHPDPRIRHRWPPNIVEGERP